MTYWCFQDAASAIKKKKKTTLKNEQNTRSNEIMYIIKIIVCIKYVVSLEEAVSAKFVIICWMLGSLHKMV